MDRQSTQNYFEGQPVFVGIDYHKKNWKVTIMGRQYEHKSFSQDPDPHVLVNYLRKNFPGGDYHAVYEAGFSGFSSCRKLNALGVKCQMIHPADVPTNQKERLQKTDKADSRKLARALRNGELEAIHIPTEELEADRSLVRQRYRVMKDLARIKNRIKSLLLQYKIEIPEKFTTSQQRHWSKIFINWLQSVETAHKSLKLCLDNHIRIGLNLRKELLLINKQVKNLSTECRYKKNFELLISVPGIGLLVAMSLLTQLGEIDRFDKLDKLCNYIGLVPSMHSSGDKIVTGKIIKRGRKQLKIMLIEASWIAVRNDPVLMAKFTELTKTMQKNKAIIRIARKLLSRIRYVLKNKEPYVIGVVK